MMKELLVTTPELDGLTTALQLLSGKLQQTASTCVLKAKSVSFFNSEGKCIGYFDIAGQTGWIQRAAGGSETIGGVQ